MLLWLCLWWLLLFFSLGEPEADDDGDDGAECLLLFGTA
jgi:hypothetical protein